jgi:spore maturation protein A
MNAIFSVIFLIATAITLVRAPQDLLVALVSGASRAATLCISLVATYAVWLGLMNLWEETGVSKGISKLLRPACKRLFKTDDNATLTAVSMNLASNMLGVSGASTPYGVKAAQLLDKTDHAKYSSAMLFILNATSIQLVPTSVIGLRTALGSSAPADVVLPTLLTTLFSTAIGVALTCLFLAPKRAKNRSVILKKGVAGLR